MLVFKRNVGNPLNDQKFLTHEEIIRELKTSERAINESKGIQ